MWAELLLFVTGSITEKILDFFKTDFTQIVLQLASVIERNFFGNTESDQNGRKNLVAFVHALCDFKTSIGQAQMAFGADSQKTVALKRMDSDGNGGLGETQVIDYVDGADAALLFAEHVDGLEIVFTGFMNGHGGTSLWL